MNTLPPPTSLAEFTERVRCLCALHACSVTSWGRTELRNAAVGGGERSWHRLERGMLGVDLVPDRIEKINVREQLVRDARRLGFDAIDELDHVHLEPRS